MTRKRAAHKYLELSRRIYLQANGTLKGWGKIAKFYRGAWRPDVAGIGGYEAAWESDVMQDLLRSVGM